MTSVFGALNGNLLAKPRVAYAMARDVEGSPPEECAPLRLLADVAGERLAERRRRVGRNGHVAALERHADRGGQGLPLCLHEHRSTRRLLTPAIK
jgi:hypothetical protein